MRTVDEKYNYNKKRSDPFSRGYCRGVALYRDYNKLSDKDKAIVKSYIDTARACRDQDSKGVMCGYRDAANERKRHSALAKKFRR